MPPREDDGRNAAVEEVLCLGPDTSEALDRVEDIERLITKHLSEFSSAIATAQIAMRALRGDMDLLREEIKGDRAELERRLLAVQKGAERMGYPFLALPKLRIVTGLPPNVPA